MMNNTVANNNNNNVIFNENFVLECFTELKTMVKQYINIDEHFYIKTTNLKTNIQTFHSQNISKNGSNKISVSAIFEEIEYWFSEFIFLQDFYNFICSGQIIDQQFFDLKIASSKKLIHPSIVDKFDTSFQYNTPKNYQLYCACQEFFNDEIDFKEETNQISFNTNPHDSIIDRKYITIKEEFDFEQVDLLKDQITLFQATLKRSLKTISTAFSDSVYSSSVSTFMEENLTIPYNFHPKSSNFTFCRDNRKKFDIGIITPLPMTNDDATLGAKTRGKKTRRPLPPLESEESTKKKKKKLNTSTKNNADHMNIFSPSLPSSSVDPKVDKSCGNNVVSPSPITFSKNDSPSTITFSKNDSPSTTTITFSKNDSSKTEQNISEDASSSNIFNNNISNNNNIKYNAEDNNTVDNSNFASSFSEKNNKTKKNCSALDSFQLPTSSDDDSSNLNKNKKIGLLKNNKTNNNSISNKSLLTNIKNSSFLQSDNDDDIKDDDDKNNDDDDDSEFNNSEDDSQSKHKKTKHLKNTSVIFHRVLKNEIKKDFKNVILNTENLDNLIINFFMIFILQQIKLLYFNPISSTTDLVSIADIQQEIFTLVYTSLRFRSDTIKKRGKYQKKSLIIDEFEDDNNDSLKKETLQSSSSIILRNQNKSRNQTIKRHLVIDIKKAVQNIIDLYEIIKSERKNMAILFSDNFINTSEIGAIRIKMSEKLFLLPSDNEIMELSEQDYNKFAILIEDMRGNKELKFAVNKEKNNNKKNKIKAVIKNDDAIKLSTSSIIANEPLTSSFEKTSFAQNNSTIIENNNFEVSSFNKDLQQNEFQKLVSLWNLIIDILFINNIDYGNLGSVSFCLENFDEHFFEILKPSLYSLPQFYAKECDSSTAVNKGKHDILENVELIKQNSTFVHSVISLFLKLFNEKEKKINCQTVSVDIVQYFSANVYFKPLRHGSKMPISIKHLSFYCSIISFFDLSEGCFPDTLDDDYQYLITVEKMIQQLENILEKKLFGNQYYSLPSTMLKTAISFFKQNSNTIDQKIKNKEHIELPELLHGRPSVVDFLGGKLFVECKMPYKHKTALSNHSAPQCFILKNKKKLDSKNNRPFSKIFIHELQEMKLLQKKEEMIFLMSKENCFITRKIELPGVVDDLLLEITKHIVKKIFSPNIIEYKKNNSEIFKKDKFQNLLVWAEKSLNSIENIENLLYGNNNTKQNIIYSKNSKQKESCLFEMYNSRLICFGLEPEKKLDYNPQLIKQQCLEHENAYIIKLIMMRDNFYSNKHDRMYRFPYFQKKIISYPSNSAIDESDVVVASLPTITNYYDCVYDNNMGDNIMWACTTYVSIQISLEFDKLKSIQHKINLLHPNVYHDFQTMCDRHINDEVNQLLELDKILNIYKVGFTGKEENVFEKEFCLMPVHQVNHYFLVLILFGGLTNIEETPCILIFDSLKPDTNSVLNTINSFLKLRWKKFYPHKNEFSDLPIFTVDNAVKQTDLRSCGYCTVFNTQNVLKMIWYDQIKGTPYHLSTNFSVLITEKMKDEMNGYLKPFSKNVLQQRDNARDQLCTWAKFLSNF